MRYDDTGDDASPSLYNGKTAPQLATEAETAVRGIVHLTEADATLLEPEELYRALSGLTRLVEQLPESITRIAAQLTSAQEAGGLVVTAGRFHGDPHGAVEAMNQAIRDQVIPRLAQVRTGLGLAQASVDQVSSAADGDRS